ncbi:response regulator transcription factor [Caulobacter rhizosphaerae]|uniref:response regulator transcription factor n=1 Tax=Caulobacter rhizosphaerae TaxID=2010972 RepID=UPI001E5E479A|nr:response regulator transcription factor [Caulobacter rhizosphaerae]
MLIEDEQQMALALKAALNQHGFVVDHVDTLALARESIMDQVHEVLLVDRQLPDGDGLRLLSEMRKRGVTTPAIILSARNDAQDRISGLDEGADDYIGKPFLIDELIARVRAASRRSQTYLPSHLLEGDLLLDLTCWEASVAGQPLHAPRRELQLLQVLLRRAGRTVPRRMLEDAVYGYDDEIQSNALDSHISRLRKRLSDAGAKVEIRTVRGVGYLLRVGA